MRGNNVQARERRQLIWTAGNGTMRHRDGRVCQARGGRWFWIEAVAGKVQVGTCRRKHVSTDGVIG